MADPSIFLVTCMGRTPSPPKLNQATKLPEYYLQQDLNLNQPRSPSPCISRPEVLRVAAAKSSTSKPSASVGNLVNAAPKPTPPEPLSPYRSTRSTHPAPPPILGLNSQGEAVSQLQTKLRQLGYYTGTIDGLYGPLTKAAVAKFQHSRKIKVDGIAGIRTWTELQRSTSHTTTGHSSKPKALHNQKQATSAAMSSQSNAQHEVDTSLAIQSLLGAGALIIYIGGWILILKDLTKELRGYKSTAPLNSNRDFEAAIRRMAAQPTQNGAQRIPITVQQHIARGRGADPSFTSANSLDSEIPNPNQSPIAKSRSLSPSQGTLEPELEQQLLQVIDANGGFVHPLRDLFTGLDSGITTNQLEEQGIILKQQALIKSPSPSPVADKQAEETVVATLSKLSKDQKPYVYSLIEDAMGLFVLRDNELRVVNYLLKDCRFSERRVTVRRTDANGVSVDKSFNLEIEKMRPPRQAEPALAS